MKSFKILFIIFLITVPATPNSYAQDGDILDFLPAILVGAKHNAVCGNGVIEFGEECDDGNTVDGDGCAADCTIEAEAIDCAPLSSPTNGFVSYDSTTEGSVANYSCYAGYTLTGDPERICQSDGSWSGAEPTCDGLDPCILYPNICDDGLACTIDFCTRTGDTTYSCSYDAINPSSCLIDGVCYAGGASSPYDCGWCDPNNSQTSWTPRPTTFACRAAINECDVTEYCNGNTLICPGDSFKSAGTFCGANGTCDGQGICIDYECPTGQYLLSDSCAPWTNCNPGQYVLQEGTPTSDRICADCPYATFSDTMNASSCNSWSVCPVGYQEVSPGTSTSDRICEPIKLDAGQPCVFNSECLSGFCVDGVCCNTSCTGICETCATLGFEGICSYIPSGTDPDGECSAGQTCDGAGVCQ